MSDYIYVCSFSSGHVKVGRSINPKSRVASHADRLMCVGIELVEHHIVECVGHSAPAEAALIERCTELATKRNKSEWFEGLEFLVVCNIADAAASENFTDQPIKKSKSCVKKGLRDFLDCLPKGGIGDFAKKIGVSTVYLLQMTNGYRAVSAMNAMSIERATGGSVTRQELRPDDYWTIWPDIPAPIASVEEA